MEGIGPMTPQRVLLVEDDAHVRRGLDLRMRAAGYQVLLAADGEEGLRAAREHVPDAVLLDIRMPVMDGLTMLAELRALPEPVAEVPVVVLSANVAEKAKSRALELGAKHFVEKPYEAGALMKALAAAVT